MAVHSFADIDTSDDCRITVEELRVALPSLAKWGLPADADPVAVFAEIDTNGGGVACVWGVAWSGRTLFLPTETHIPPLLSQVVLFDEFAAWAMAKHASIADGLTTPRAPASKPTSARRAPGASAGGSSTSSSSARGSQQQQPAVSARKPPPTGLGKALPKWQKVCAGLPVTTSEADKKERARLFAAMDVNGNGYLSLAEVGACSVCGGLPAFWFR